MYFLRLKRKVWYWIRTTTAAYNKRMRCMRVVHCVKSMVLKLSVWADFFKYIDTHVCMQYAFDNCIYHLKNVVLTLFFVISNFMLINFNFKADQTHLIVLQ